MAGNQQKIGVTLAFQADTRAAKQQIDNLQTSLNKVMLTTSRTSGQLAFTKELTEASAAAAQLKTHIQNAVNVNTGKLDLSKFNQSLKQSGMSISQYRQALSQAGAAGQQAFNQLAISITTAEVPLVRISSGLKKLGTTLANTARWQISSSLLMGFTSAISNAYNYAQDLNESLNNIRIVTGYNIEQMDKFATAATKAAKALSTTTTKYTDASLIYFQQGLNDQQVQQRTDLTIKMANVIGESVSKVSDQLTAIWNNFDNGTQSLEHYVDVMVALGAATASSTDEISEGLNKFAAIAETVGLSYEYAASALATVTATTRQSADVVGTAFKTLFARIQDLELGKTLDDGTTMGQYSQALASIGINIKDANGQVKDMNSILDEMGAKWNSLNKAQQIALAQNVAGVRQYTQLIALMDNWDYFQENLATANASAGALTEQADIYAESWQAARDRVTASLEDIYNKLLEDDAFIEILNFFEKFLKQISNTIDSLGGLQGVLTTIGTVLLNVFSQQIAQGMTNLAFSLKTLTKTGRQELLQLQQDATKEMAASYGKTGLSALQGQAAASMSTAQQHYAKEAASMNDTQKEIAQHILAQQQGLAEAAMNQAEYTREAEKTAKVLANAARADMRQNGKEAEEITTFNSQINQAKSYGAANTIASGLQKFDEDVVAADVMKDASVIVEDLQAHLNSLGITSKEIPSTMSQMIKSIDGAEDAFKTYAAAVEAADVALKGDDEAAKIAAIDALIKAEQDLNATIGVGAVSTKNMSKAQREAIDAAKGAGVAYGRTAIKAAEAEVNVQRLPEAMRKATTQVRRVSQDIVAFAQGLGSISMALSSFKGIIDVLNNEDMTFWEKLLSIITSLSMTIPMLITGWKALTEIEFTNTLGKIANALATWGQVEAENALQKEKGESVTATQGDNISTDLNTTKKGVNGLGKKISNKWNQNALQNSSRFKFNEKMGKTGRWVDTSQGNKIVSKDAALKGAGTDALKGLGKAAGKFAITAAIVVAAVAAGKAIYDAADEAYNRDEYAAQKAEKAAQELAKAYGKVADKYNELDTASKNYSEGIKSLDELTKGTVEYQEQISKTNEEALKLINTYDELAGQYHTTAEGLIVFNEGALENIKLLELQRKNTAATAATIASQEAREARAQANTTKFLREDIDSKNTVTTEDGAIIGKGTGIGLAGGAIAGGTVLASTLAGTKIGTALGNVIPIPGVGAIIGAIAGTVIGASIGLVGAAIDKNEAAKNEKKSIEALSEAYNKIGNAALTPDNMKSILETKGITDPKLIESLGKNSEELEKLLIEIKANTEARRLENINLARERYASTDKTFTDYNNSIQTAISTIAGTADTKKSDEIDYGKKDYAFGGWYTLGTYATQEGKDQFKLWAEDQGLTDAKATNFSGNVIKYNYLDEEGVRQEKELTYDQLAAWQEGQEISQASLENYDKIRDTVVEISQLKGGEGLLNVLGGQDVNNLTLQQIQDLKAAYESGEFNDELTEMGKLNGEDYAQAVENAINSWDYDTAFANYAKKIQSEIDGILASGASETEYSAQALEDYSLSLLKNSKVLNGNGQILNEWQKTANKKIAAEMAVANAKFAKGLVALNEVMTDSVDILDEWNERSLETWEAVGKIQEALEDTFGVKVSADYVKEHLNEIKQLATGDVSALEELQQAAAKDFIINLDISENAKTNMVSMIDSFISQAEMQAQGIELDVGANLDLASYTDQLNKMLEAGDITADEVKKTFAAIGYAVDIKTTKKEVTNTSQFVMDDPISGKQWKGSITNTSVMDVPYIAGEGTAQTGQEITTSTGDNVTVGYKEKGTGFTYTGGADTKAELAANIQKESLKNAKRIEDEIKRYHELKEILSDLEREYKRISDAKNRAWGPDKLAYMKQEQAILEKQLTTQQDLVNAMKKDVNRDWDVLAKYGAGRDLHGRITNYEELYQTQINKYNISHNKEEYEKFVKAIEQYEASLNGLEEEQQKLLDKNNEIADSKIEEIQYTVEHTVEKIDYLFNALEHQLKNLDDPIDDAAKAIAVLGQQTEQALKKIKAYEMGISDIFTQSNLTDSDVEALIGGDMSVLDGKQLTEAQVSALTEYQKTLWETNEELNNMGDTVHEKVVAAVEEMNSKLDEQSESISHNNALLENYRNIIDLVGQDALGISDQVMANLSRASVQGAQAELQAAKAKFDTNKAIYDDTLAEYNAIADQLSDEEKARWNETIKNLEKQLTSAEEAFMSSWENALQAAADAFDEAVNNTVQTFKDAMAGIAGSNDVLSQRFEQQKEISERYLDDYQKIYELSKLNRDLNKSIDDTDSVIAKTKLRDLQEEINNLQESNTEMTQYEVDELRARYELRLAEIALEEAQNAKSQVRMRRDSEGSWSYVYTADQDAVVGAQQGYEDKLYAYQELTQNYIDEIESALIEIPAQMADAIAAIDKNAYESEEQYLKAVEEVRAYYTGLYEYHLKQMNGAIEDSAYVYQNDWLAYNEKTGYKISREIEWRNNFNETIYAQTTGYTTAESALSNFVTNADTLLDTLAGHYSDWKNDVNTAFDLAGKDVEDFEKTVDEKTKDIQQDNKDTAQSATDMETKFDTAYDDILDEASTWATKYSTIVQAVIDKNNEVASSISNILALYKRVVDEKPDLSGDYNPEEGDPTGGNPEGTIPPEKPGPPETTFHVEKAFFNKEDGKTGQGAYTGLTVRKSDISGLVIDDHYDYGYFNYGGRTFYIKEEIARLMAKELGITPNIIARALYTGGGPRTPVVWDQFDTGGYTGAWGSEGRLAMLHQKEIVLNADDTENFLSAIRIIRDISHVIDLRAAAQQAALSEMYRPAVMPSNNSLQQEVTIHAEFPNATNRGEIEAAFDTLINRASQFANRKK